jgi:hypothetical protein
VTPSIVSSGLAVLKEMILGRAAKDHAVLRSLSALMASLPATESPGFREEFDTVRRPIRGLGLGVL